MKKLIHHKYMGYTVLERINMRIQMNIRLEEGLDKGIKEILEYWVENVFLKNTIGTNTIYPAYEEDSKEEWIRIK